MSFDLNTKNMCSGFILFLNNLFHSQLNRGSNDDSQIKKNGLQLIYRMVNNKYDWYLKYFFLCDRSFILIENILHEQFRSQFNFGAKGFPTEWKLIRYGKLIITFPIFRVNTWKENNNKYSVKMWKTHQNFPLFLFIFWLWFWNSDEYTCVYTFKYQWPTVTLSTQKSKSKVWLLIRLWSIIYKWNTCVIFGWKYYFPQNEINWKKYRVILFSWMCHTNCEDGQAIRGKPFGGPFYL